MDQDIAYLLAEQMKILEIQCENMRNLAEALRSIQSICDILRERIEILEKNQKPRWVSNVKTFLNRQPINKKDN